MTRSLVIEPTGFGLRGGLLDQDRLVELLDIDEAGHTVSDGLFLGRVDKLDRQLGAAFVDIGAAQPAFLNAKDARAVVGTVERMPIDRLLREGQRLIVQGVREAAAGKGPRVTADVKLFGFWLILRPLGQGVEIPGRLAGRAAELLLERGRGLFGEAGITLRRSAASADDATLAGEQQQLAERWQRLQREAADRKRPGRLQADESLLERLLRQALDFRPARIIVADPVLATATGTLLRERLAAAGLAFEHLAHERSAFEVTGVRAGIEEALGRDVPLPGGGRLRIEETAACTAIDVDGAGRAALDADLSAVAEVAGQIRLRNLGGTIVIDFIDLPTRPQRQRLDEALKKAFRDDPLGVQLYPMSPLGLVQLSRPRRGQTLAALMTRPCPCCNGGGRVPSLRARVEELMVQLRSGAAVRSLRASRDLSTYLQGEAASSWQAIAGRPAIEIDASLPAGEWRLE